MTPADKVKQVREKLAKANNGNLDARNLTMVIGVSVCFLPALGLAFSFGNGR